jgi:hypothetical protein
LEDIYSKKILSVGEIANIVHDLVELVYDLIIVYDGR